MEPPLFDVRRRMDDSILPRLQMLFGTGHVERSAETELRKLTSGVANGKVQIRGQPPDQKVFVVSTNNGGSRLQPTSCTFMRYVDTPRERDGGFRNLCGGHFKLHRDSVVDDFAKRTDRVFPRFRSKTPNFIA